MFPSSRDAEPFAKDCQFVVVDGDGLGHDLLAFGCLVKVGTLGLAPKALSVRLRRLAKFDPCLPAFFTVVGLHGCFQIRDRPDRATGCADPLGQRSQLPVLFVLRSCGSHRGSDVKSPGRALLDGVGEPCIHGGDVGIVAHGLRVFRRLGQQIVTGKQLLRPRRESFHCEGKSRKGI